MLGVDTLTLPLPVVDVLDLPANGESRSSKSEAVIGNPNGYKHLANKSTLEGDKVLSPPCNVLVVYAGSPCPGTAVNRNYDCEGGGEGLGDFVVYRGPRPCVESEMASVSDVVLQPADSVNFFLNVHTFGTEILQPLGNPIDPVPDLDLGLATRVTTRFLLRWSHTDVASSCLYRRSCRRSLGVCEFSCH